MTTTGIHGFPKVKWDNVEDAGLYYPHNTFTFPTWHRPYMLLYEQYLYEIMEKEIVPSIEDETAKKKKVKILELGGRVKEEVANPLEKFYNTLNGEKIAMGDQQKWEALPSNTTRSPSITDALRKNSIAHEVFRILTQDYFQSYGPFSSTPYKEGLTDETGGSDKEGGEGHMANVPVEAFDPIFWLHHCNVDRLFAIWQYLNHTKWFDNSGEGLSKPTKPFDPSKPLKPYHKDVARTLYSSNDTQYWEPLGYTYHELLETILKLQSIDGRKLPGGIGHDGFKEYINVEYDRYSLDGEPYIVYYHVKGGDLPDHIGDVRQLGSFVNFSAPMLPDHGDCAAQKQSSVKSKAQVPITFPLHGLEMDRDNPDAGSMERFPIEPSGEEILLEHVPELHVTVYGGDALYPTYASLDVFETGTYEPLWWATHGKRCGAKQAKQRVG
ncbi:common central domain of tyrosinase-domain-containing protein [Aspergillus leporis]|uniref:tyrosinase n=1 Tax=Aspergillus leporis TaxID=41062 RepID=A0A5N5X5W7_9EURO|nr:common central domain of tyrosinase-domain-containing protein [Aspergillus leporis]